MNVYVTFCGRSVLVPRLYVKNIFACRKRDFVFDLLGKLLVGIRFENDFRIVAESYPLKTELSRIVAHGKGRRLVLVVYDEIVALSDGIQFNRQIFFFCGIVV